MLSTNSKLSHFRKTVWGYYKKHGRHTLPWRKTRDPYKILVSEVMLQQTQVDRVVPYYHTFLKTFPTARALSRAPLSLVLRVWQGLGYNRRAKMLHEAAKAITKEYNGRFPEDASMLPGVGPYTARAIDAFSRNNNVIVVETNIRTAVLHHFFTKEKTKNHIIYDMVSDTEIEAVLIEALPLGHSREWYSALMDYGAYLKRSGIRLNRRHKGYTKQSKFTGSNREARGAILRALAKRPQTEAMLVTILGEKRKKQMEAALVALRKEQMIQKRGSRYRLAR